MTGPAILARLNPRIASLNNVGGGGDATITADDIAYAMGAKLRGERPNRIEWAVAMLRYAGQEECRIEVQQWLMAVALKLRTPERGQGDAPGWRRCSFEQVTALAEMTLSEFCPDRRCGACNGRAVVPNVGGIPEVCQECSGRGWVRVTGADKACALGVDESSYYRTWARREAALMARLIEVDGRVRDRVAAV